MIESKLGEALRQLRTKQNLSLRSLADRTGFSASFLSQVENGQASPSISSMEKIAHALGVTLWQFFQTVEQPAPSVVRAHDRPGVGMLWSKAQTEALRLPGNGCRLDPVLVTIEPGGCSGKLPEPSQHEEFAFLVAGSARLTLETETLELAVGDAVAIPRSVARHWQNHTAAAVHLLVVTLPSLGH